MDKEEFMKQSAESMSIKELAEAIKLKSVLRTEKDELRVGDKVECAGYSFGPAIGIIKEKVESNLYLVELIKTNNGTEIGEKWRYTKGELELIRKPKAIWKDITKKCDFIPTRHAGYYMLEVRYKDEQIAFSGNNSDNKNDKIINLCSITGYKVVCESNFRDFKILRRE